MENKDPDLETRLAIIQVIPSHLAHVLDRLRLALTVGLDRSGCRGGLEAERGREKGGKKDVCALQTGF